MPWQNPYHETHLNFLGIDIHRLTREQLLHCFETALETPGPVHFGYLNIAVSNQAADDPEVEDLLNSADLVYVDGAGIRLGCRLLGVDCPPRNTGADFFPEVLEICARMGKKVGFLGGSPGAAERLRDIYTQRFQGLNISFVKDGAADIESTGDWYEELRQDPPDLLIVGLGVPKQEKWVTDHRKQLGVKLYWTVGALFEYDSGRITRCPRWMGKLGLEWLFRLLVEPRRLWRRYLIGNPRFLLRCLSSRWRGRGGIP